MLADTGVPGRMSGTLCSQLLNSWLRQSRESPADTYHACDGLIAEEGIVQLGEVERPAEHCDE